MLPNAGVRMKDYFETERLILRRYRETDLDDLYEYLSDEEVLRFEPYRAMNLDETRKTLAYRIGSERFFAVELKENHKMIGNVYIEKSNFDSYEIGFVFNRKYSKRGYATEACRRAVDELFSRGVHRVFAKCDQANTDSWRLLERLGFTREGNFKQNVFFWADEDGKPIWKDTYLYAQLNLR